MGAESDLRSAALKAMDRFADEHNVTNREWQEERAPGHVRFIGTTDDGRRFGIGYALPNRP